MKLFDKLAQRWNKRIDPRFAFLRSHFINNDDFSIICNNCWGGYVYRRYGLPYLTPTVGLFLWADDYIKMCQNLRHYLEECSLDFITIKESKHSGIYKVKGYEQKPIARLGDIEIVFLHYESEEEAREKWERRAKRVNYDNLIYKFSQMNGCTQKDMMDFESMNAQKKIMFISEDSGRYKCGISIQKTGEISDDTTHYSKYIKIEKMINSASCCGNWMEGIFKKRTEKYDT